MPTGRCHCGKIAYRFTGEPGHRSVCHCEDCRRCAGATGVAWLSVARGQFAIERGEPRLYRSSANTERYFCGDCGSGLYYVNEQVLPGLVDIQIATLDDPEAYPPELHVQMDDALTWEEGLPGLPAFARYPG